MGRKRREYTDEERAARAEADAAIEARGEAILANPAAVTTMVDTLLATTSKKLLRYSVRNAAMLIGQAEERGMTLTDVDSFKGWRQRGRAVRKGEISLRIVAPKGSEKTDASDTDDAPEAPEPTGNDGDGKPAKTRFRMAPVFDISQTDGVEDIEPDADQVVTNVPAVLRANLVDQIERRGYTVVEGKVGPVIDDDARTITVAEDLPGDLLHLHQLAQGLAELVTRPPAERPKLAPATVRGRSDDAACMTPARPADPRAPYAAVLELGENYGTARVTVRTDWKTGRTFYDITAPRVTGTVTVTPGDSIDQIHSLNVDHGEHDGRSHFYDWDKPYPKPLTINGVELASGTHGIDPARVATLDKRRVHARRPYRLGQAPEATQERMAAVLRAVLLHFLDRSDLAELRDINARRAAAHRTRDERRAVDSLDTQIQELTAEREQRSTRADLLEDLAEHREQLPLFANP